MAIKELNHFLLSGGTSLALRIGQRQSIAIDLFRFGKLEHELIKEIIFNNFKVYKFLYKNHFLLQIMVNDIKIDFVGYHKDFISKPLIVENIRLASTKDVAVMKLSAITRRGSKIDFIDLYFFLTEFSFKEILSFYEQKYGLEAELYLFRSFVFFEDSDRQTSPILYKSLDWMDVKKKIEEEVRIFFNQNTL